MVNMKVKERKIKKDAKYASKGKPAMVAEAIQDDEPLTSQFETNLLAAFLFTLSVAIYLLTVYPGLPMGDSGEFMVTAIDFGVAHPPGYPLFTTLTYLVINLIPFGSVAWRVNLLSVLFGAMFNVTIYYTVSLLGKNSVVGFLTAGWIGFSRLFWMWSIQGEIFSLNNFFCALIMLHAYLFEASSGDNVLKQAKRAALICGLSLSNQHTSLLFIFPFALRVAFRVLVLEGNTLRDACTIAIYGLTGMAWYFQMVISHFYFTPRVTWGDFGSPATFVKHMLRLDYGSSFKLVAGDTESTFLSNFLTFVIDSSAELSVAPWLCCIFLVGFAMSKSSRIFRNTTKVHLAMICCYFVVFCSLANIENPTGLSRGVLERFWMQPSICLLILGGIGLCKMTVYAANTVHPSFRSKYFQLALAVLGIAAQIKANYRENDESGNMFSYHYAQSILPHLPNNSIMLTGGDLPTNVFRYHTICEQIRPDVRVMDMQFMSADWFRDILAPTTFAGINIPGVYRPSKTAEITEGQYNLKMFLDLNIDKFPIFACNNVRADEKSFNEVYIMIPFGTCRKFYRKKDLGNPVEILERSPDVVLDGWPMPNTRVYEDRTWEYQLKKVYLSSMGEKATTLWHLASEVKHSGNRRYLLEHAALLQEQTVKMIEEAIVTGTLHEDVWGLMYEQIPKNMGHICMMLHTFVLEEGPEKESRRQDLENCGRKYWQIYVDWAILKRNKEEAPLVDEIRKYLAMDSFKNLKFNM